jgi:ubiquitin C-terminal hydrolase
MNGCGLVNMGNYCYLNSILQMLYHTDELNEYLKNARKINNIPESFLSLELIKLNKNINENSRVSPREFITKMIEIARKKGREEFCFGDQNDANEFFYFIIENIHNSFNKIEKIELPKTSYSIINTYLVNIEKKESSIINKLFMSCILYNYVNIKTQKREFYKIEHGNTIELTIPNTKNITLDMCFLETFKEDTMIDDNAWYDENTKTKKGVIKKSFICYFPEILVIQLKRWNTNLYKNSSLVISPFIFDLQPYTIYEKHSNCKYELFGIINHHGSVKGGHYYIYIKKNGWFVIDDETIQKIPENKIINERNYCLFYRKLK